MIFAPASSQLVPWMQPQFGRGRESSSPTTYEALILSDNPVGYWRLGEASGTSIIDASTESNNGTYSGSITLGEPGAISGDPNTSVLFSGGLGVIPEISVYDFGTGDFSVEAWVNLTSSGTNVAFSNFGGGSQLYWMGQLGGVPTFSINGGVVSGGSINDGQWHHFVSVRSIGSVTLYIDGSSVATGTLLGDVNSLAGVVIASLGSPSVFAWIGLLDEVALYGYGLTSTQVLAHYNKGI